MHLRRGISMVLAIAMTTNGFFALLPSLADDNHGTPPPANKVASLASRNKPPLLGNPRQRPAFDARFDWAEQGRVWRVVKDLVAAPAESWSSLVTHIDDREYCVTVESGEGTFSNWTVGDSCRIVLSRTLSEPYFCDLSPMTRELHAEFRRPSFARDPRTLKEWLLARADTPLAHMQAEACESAIAQLSRRDDKNRDTWVAAIHATASRLRSGNPPIAYHGFSTEEIRPCSRPVLEDDPFAADNTAADQRSRDATTIGTNRDNR